MNTNTVFQNRPVQEQGPAFPQSGEPNSWWSSITSLFQDWMGGAVSDAQPADQAPPLQERAAHSTEGSWLTRLIHRLFASLADRVSGLVTDLFGSLQEPELRPSRSPAASQRREDLFERVRDCTNEYTREMGSSLSDAARGWITDLGATVAEAMAPYRATFENEIIQEVPSLFRGAARFAFHRMGGPAAAPSASAEAAERPPAAVPADHPVPAELQPQQPANPSALQQMAANVSHIQSGVHQVANAAAGLRDQIVRGWGALRQGLGSLFSNRPDQPTA